MAKLYISIMLSFLFSFNIANAEGFTGTEHGYWGFNNTGESLFIVKSNSNVNFNDKDKILFLKNSSEIPKNSNFALLENKRVTSNSISFDYQAKNVEQGVLGLEVLYEGKWKAVWKIDLGKNTVSNDDWITQVVRLNFFPGDKSLRFFATTSGEDDEGGISLSDVSLLTVATNSLIEYKYDELGRLICAVDNLNGAREFEYDDAGNRKNVSIGSCN